MKKYIFILIQVIFLFHFGKAQNEIGISTGVVNSIYDFRAAFDENFDKEWAGIGYQGNIFFKKPLWQSNFSMIPNISYTYQRQNMFIQENKKFGSAKWTEKINTMGLDVLFRYQFPAKFISPYFEFGSSWIFNLNGVASKSIPDSSYQTPSVTIEFGKSTNDTYKSTVFGWTLGAGLNAEFDFGNLGLGIRYFGAPDIINHKLKRYGLVTINDDNKIKLRNLMLSLSYSLPLGGY